MTKLVAYEKELRKAFLRNLEAAERLAGTPSVCSGLMLLFYAVECGLKHMLCVRNRGSYLEGANPLFKTHNLGALLKELRIPGGAWPQVFHLARKRESHPSGDSHLAWRYGVEIDDVDQRGLKDELERLAVRIKEDIQ